MKTSIFELISNKKIAKNTYEWVLSGDTSDITASGQFVNIELSGFYLRRPISVCDARDGRLTLIFKAVGEGTEKMALAKPGDKFDLLTGLGNGYDIPIVKLNVFAFSSFQHAGDYDLGQIIALTDDGAANASGRGSNLSFH